MILEVIDQGRIERIGVVNGSAGKDIDGRAYLQDLVQKLNEIEVEKVKSPMHIRFGSED